MYLLVDFFINFTTSLKKQKNDILKQIFKNIKKR